MLVGGHVALVGELEPRRGIEDLLEARAVHRADGGERRRRGQAAARVILGSSIALLLLIACGGAMQDGRRAMARGEFEAAAQAFRRATAEHPDDPQVWLALGREHDAARATERGKTLADRWRAGAIIRADAEYAFALVLHATDPDVARDALTIAAARLHAMSPMLPRRTRIAHLRGRLEEVATDTDRS